MSLKEPTKKQENPKDGLKRNEKKWTPELMQAGWMLIPSVLLERQHTLGLDAVDINIILHLVSFWWDDSNLPYPSKRKIAERMGIDPSTVRRHIARMEKDGFIKREYRKDEKQGQQTNRYSFTGLIKAAKPLAEEAVALKKKQREERAASNGRSRRAKAA